jgi:hypothetical protein
MIYGDPDALVQDMYDDGELKVEIRKELSSRQMMVWDELYSNKLLDVEITGERDEVAWALDKKGQYTTKSLYRFLSFGGWLIGG